MTINKYILLLIKSLWTYRNTRSWLLSALLVNILTFLLLTWAFTVKTALTIYAVYYGLFGIYLFSVYMRVQRLVRGI